jgi:hypothetical protein
VGEPVAGGVLPQRHRLGRELGADDQQRLGGTGHEQRTPGEERLQDGVADPGVGHDVGAEHVGRHDDDLAALHHPRRQVRVLAGEEAHLAEEPAGAVAGDHHLVTVPVGTEDLGGAGEDDDEVVLGVARGEQDLTRLYRAALTVGGDDGQLIVVELGERRRLVDGLAHRGARIATTGPWSLRPGDIRTRFAACAATVHHVSSSLRSLMRRSHRRRYRAQDGTSEQHPDRAA